MAIKTQVKLTSCIRLLARAASKRLKACRAYQGNLGAVATSKRKINQLKPANTALILIKATKAKPVKRQLPTNHQHKAK